MTRRCSTRNKARVSSKGGQGDNASEKKVDGEVEGLVKVGQADTEDGDNGCSDALPTEAATTREMQLKARLAAVQKDGNLTQLTVVELREILKMRSRPTIGRKQDLLEELKNLVREDSEPSESGPDEVKVDIVPVTTGSGKRRRNCEVVQDTQTQVTNVDEVAFETKPHGSTGEQDAEAPAISDSTPNPELPAKRRKGVSRSVESKMKVVAAEKTVVEGFKPIWATLCHKKPQPGWIAYDPTTMRPALPSNRANFRKILSWNVNGIRAVLKGKDPKVHDAVVFQELAEKEDFDVLCLQETKLQEKDVDKVKQCLLPNYEESFWSCSTSKAGYSGTAIISRVKPLSVSYGLGIQDHDQEGRAITVEFDSYFLVTSYVPNSGDGLKRLDYRVTSWDPALSTYVTELEKKKPVILTGDFNCSHQEMDLADPNGNRKSAGFTAEERASFEKHFLKKGLVDTFRRQHPDAVGYTYWGYRSGARARNHGWRLDYFLASESLRDRLFDSYSMPHIQGSDHCPIGLIVSV